MKNPEFPHLFLININKLQYIKKDKEHKWGYEVWLVNDKKLGICCKLLVIYPGWMSSIHEHANKNEYFQMLSGALKLYIWDGDDGGYKVIELEVGKQYFVPANTDHRFVSDTEEPVLLLEMSTFEDEQTHKTEKAREL
jgi:mannose-6-phosphate isomerase-like protein (cupin superfamily)